MSKFPEGVPTITVNLGGLRELAFTLGTLRRLKEKIGTLDVATKPDPLLLSTYVWACMSADDRETFTIELIDDLIPIERLQEITDQIVGVYTRSVTKQNPTAAAEPEPEAAAVESAQEVPTPT